MRIAHRFHCEVRFDIAASPAEIFALLDDHSRLAAHMEKPSLMMAGATMHITTDVKSGQAIGSFIRMQGQILGIPLSVEEVVDEYAQPLRKAWETVGEPQLLVIGEYRMGFTLFPISDKTRLSVWLDYDLSKGRWTYQLESWLAKTYAD